MTAPDLMKFAGRWSLSRQIDDRHSGGTGTLTGVADFTPEGDRLLYSETGQLRIGDAPPMEATRRYIWRAAEDRIEVLFDDGRPFHFFTASGQGEGTDHLCGADLYRVSYDFTNWPEWSAQWTVQGPRKDYVMMSRYRLLNT